MQTVGDSMKRAYYIDRLRILLILLLIFHHSAIAFGARGGWYYITPQAATGSVQFFLSLFMAIDQAFFWDSFFSFQRCSCRHPSTARDSGSSFRIVWCGWASPWSSTPFSCTRP